MEQIIILGGGISGLSLAYFLQKKEPEARITLIEKNERLGGWCHSERKQDFLFEKGPRCFKASRSFEINSLIKELKLQNEVIVSSKEAETRYIYHKNKLRKIPSSFFSFVTSPLTRKVFFPLIKDFFSPKKFIEEESIFSFVERRLGTHAANILFDPFTLGIYAGDVKRLSMGECFPSLHEAIRQKKSVLSSLRAFQKEQQISRQLSYTGLISFKKGNFSFIEALKKACNKVSFHLNTEVIKIEPGKKTSRVITPGLNFEADKVYIALPKEETQKLFVSLDDLVYTLLSQIECASVASVNLGYDREFFPERFFGYLVPSFKKDIHMGTLFESSIFPDKMKASNLTALGVMLGGMHHPEIAEKTEEEIIELAKEAVYKYLKIEELPKFISVTKATKALPQFYPGHKKKIEAITSRLKERFPKIVLAGNYLEGVSVNDCIAYARKISSY